MTPEEIRKQMMGSAGFNVEFPEIEAKSLVLQVSHQDIVNPKSGDILNAVEPEFLIASLIDEEVEPLLCSYESSPGKWLIEDYATNKKHSLYANNVCPQTIRSIFIKYLKGDPTWRDGADWSRDAEAEAEEEAEMQDLNEELNQDNDLLEDASEEEACPQLPTQAKKVVQSNKKSYWIAIALAVVFGPFGLLYISWKRALVVLAIWIVAVALFHNPILFWIVLSAGSVVLMGTGSGKHA
jgi:hypothetical protein